MIPKESGEPQAKSQDTALQRDIARAKSQQEMLRKIAPKISVGSSWVDKMAAVARQYVPEAFEESAGVGPKRKVTGKAATHSVFYDSPQRHKQSLEEGWEPVVVEGEHVGCSGDLLYKRPVEFSRDAIKRAERESSGRLESLRQVEADNEGMRAFREMEEKQGKPT